MNKLTTIKDFQQYSDQQANIYTDTSLCNELYDTKGAKVRIKIYPPSGKPYWHKASYNRLYDALKAMDRIYKKLYGNQSYSHIFDIANYID